MRSLARRRLSTLNAILLLPLTLAVFANGGCSSDSGGSNGQPSNDGGTTDGAVDGRGGPGDGGHDGAPMEASSDAGFIQGPLVQMSTDSTFAANCGDPAEGNINYTNTNVEPS